MGGYNDYDGHQEFYEEEDQQAYYADYADNRPDGGGGFGGGGGGGGGGSSGNGGNGALAVAWFCQANHGSASLLLFSSAGWCHCYPNSKRTAWCLAQPGEEG